MNKIKQNGQIGHSSKKLDNMDKIRQNWTRCIKQSKSRTIEKSDKMNTNWTKCRNCGQKWTIWTLSKKSHFCDS